MKIAFLMVVVLVAPLAAQDYIGSHKCKNCHKKEEEGAQYLKWQEEPHSKAYDTLLTDKAREVATAAGITTPPHETDQCLDCHTVGFGKGGFEVKDKAFWNPAEGDKDAKKQKKRMEGLKHVGCESCHGPGGKYKKKSVMKDIFAGKVKGEDYGLIKPDKELCVSCHNEKSPTYVPFDYEKRKAEITHPYPDAFRKAKEEEYKK